MNRSLIPALSALILVVSYKNLLVEAGVSALGVGRWTALAYKAVSTLLLGALTMQVYVATTAHEKY